jgi:hypothetical protein
MNESDDQKFINVTDSPIGSGKYLLSDYTQPLLLTWLYRPSLRYDPVQSTHLGQWDAESSAPGAAVDAYFNAKKAMDYFAKYHDRNGPDGIGGRVAVVVHDPFDGGHNAYFDSTRGEMHCGDGGGDDLPICTSLDVVAHELAHGVTGATSHLEYRGESGALNESFSDVMGASAENAIEGDAPSNFLIGERGSKSGSPVRDMVNPSSVPLRMSGIEKFPDHYTKIARCASTETPKHEKNDNCYVHINSSVPNRAFSLMTAGGTNSSSGIRIAQGVGWVDARILWYYTLTHLHSAAQFKSAAFAQVFLANAWYRLYGWSQANFEAVACAWVGVGVLSADEPIVASVTKCAAPGAATSASPPNAASPGGDPSSKPSPAADPTCGGRANEWVCSKESPASAIHCIGGAPSATSYCADPDATCKRASAADPRATVSSDGALMCE